mmetsp:Transcript_18635/g.55255  ORF Transcript_18635/g.55255 Transcript_18635/m.55255 type:complete len:200 (-) Transcript_18635:162-761(-)
MLSASGDTSTAQNSSNSCTAVRKPIAMTSSRPPGHFARQRWKAAELFLIRVYFPSSGCSRMLPASLSASRMAPSAVASSWIAILASSARRTSLRAWATSVSRGSGAVDGGQYGSASALISRHREESVHDPSSPASSPARRRGQGASCAAPRPAPRGLAAAEATAALPHHPPTRPTDEPHRERSHRSTTLARTSDGGGRE